jgi:Fe-S cluster assembly protein SufD
MRGALPTLDHARPTGWCSSMAVLRRVCRGCAICRSQLFIASLGQALLTHPELIEPHLDRLPGLEQHPFAALNTAFWEDGAFIYLPRGTVVETPIHLIFHATGGDMAVHPRLLLVLEDGAQATVVVEYGVQGRYLNAPVAELAVG